MGGGNHLNEKFWQNLPFSSRHIEQLQSRDSRRCNEMDLDQVPSL